MTAIEEAEAVLVVDDDTTVTEDARFAVRWARAARLVRLPERMLLHRARSEGQAHRRSESAAELKPLQE